MRPLLLDPLERPSRAESIARFRQAFRKLPGWEGRWFLLPAGPVVEEASRWREIAGVALQRYGVLAREWRRQEDLTPSWSELYPELERSEWRGDLRRGHFLEGLAGMQFALPEAVERLRRAPAETGYLLLNACDPASPYGAEAAAGADWRVTRRPANQVLLREGHCALYAENHGARWHVRPGDAAAVAAYLDHSGRDAATVETINGQPAEGSEFAALLRERGFQAVGTGALRRRWEPAGRNPANF